MKICFANTQEHTGGAAIAAWRIFEEVHRQHPQSRYIVSDKRSDLVQVTPACSRFSNFTSRFRRQLEKRYTRLYSHGSSGIFSSARFPAPGVVRKINSLNPDIVHLHWINNGLLAIEDLQHIKAPLVWTLHDMWPFTGGCHYSGNCKRWLKNCGNCPQLKKQGNHDLSNTIFSRKLKAWSRLDLTIVTPSRWLADLTRESPLLGHFQTHVIPNGLDTNLYSPRDKSATRQSLGLPQDRSLALFGAMNATSDNRKGFDLLIESLNRLPASLHDRLDLVVFGNHDSDPVKYPGFKVHFFGNVEDEKKLVELYSAADLFISPSREDNLPNTCVEAMACGTPVVAFDIGGMSDIIQHKETGYLAKAFDTQEMAHGISCIIELLKRTDGLRIAARSHAEKYYNRAISANLYMDVYQQISSTQR